MDLEGAGPEGGAGVRRRRSGGREGHERSLLPPQRPWAQPRLRYRPTEVVSEDELESIHVASLRVLEEIGMDFLDPESREVLRAAGARVEPGSERVRFDRAMVEERIQTAPSSFTLHAPSPAHHLEIGGDWVAFGTVGSAPNVFDADHGRRVGNRADYQDLIRLCQMLDVVHFFAGYPVEPVDVHASIRHLHAIEGRGESGRGRGHQGGRGRPRQHPGRLPQELRPPCGDRRLHGRPVETRPSHPLSQEVVGGRGGGARLPDLTTLSGGTTRMHDIADAPPTDRPVRRIAAVASPGRGRGVCCRGRTPAPVSGAAGAAPSGRRAGVLVSDRVVPPALVPGTAARGPGGGR